MCEVRGATHLRVQPGLLLLQHHRLSHWPVWPQGEKSLPGSPQHCLHPNISVPVMMARHFFRKVTQTELRHLLASCYRPSHDRLSCAGSTVPLHICKATPRCTRIIPSCTATADWCEVAVLQTPGHCQAPGCVVWHITGQRSPAYRRRGVGHTSTCQTW